MEDQKPCDRLASNGNVGALGEKGGEFQPLMDLNPENTMRACPIPQSMHRSNGLKLKVPRIILASRRAVCGAFMFYLCSLVHLVFTTIHHGAGSIIQCEYRRIP